MVGTGSKTSTISYEIRDTYILLDVIYTTPSARRLGYSGVLLKYIIECHNLPLLLLVKDGSFAKEYYGKFEFLYLKKIGPYILMGRNSTKSHMIRIFQEE